ncbi:hypothetical protein OGAPHI_005495 [Ogataea philodendri]|uniref:Uncharacterized protein n=1 Tax=Ogataea philodendri TaxID=1378263 RepID=A0A9P8NZU3_9ASCO|nr:uncharacterized protein OGAPHI_005495 [Ogataea philodendri]KAH3662247.1 hypothetical protein OGAPHI_005495 [Ogataea philodendri]
MDSGLDLVNPEKLASQLREYKEPDRDTQRNVLNQRLNELVSDPTSRWFKFQHEPEELDSVALNILIERTLADVHESQHEKEIMTVQEVRLVKEQIARLTGEKAEVLAELGQNLQPDMVSRLQTVDQELTSLQNRLNTHQLLVLQLGYVQDMSFEVPIGRGDVERSLEGLVSKVVSLSAQHQVELPEPEIEKMRTVGGRIGWVSECVSTLVGGTQTVGSPTSKARQLTQQADVSSVDELKTALTDLQFAHNYLTRKFEDERDLHSKILNDLRHKLSQSQELLNHSNAELSKQTSQILKLELQNSDLQTHLDTKHRETISQAKELNILKVDHLGDSAVERPRSMYSGSQNTQASNPSTPLTSFHEEQSFAATSSPTRNNVSASILRLEFKRLVAEMNERFEQELDAEKVENQRLRDLLKIYESKQHQT